LSEQVICFESLYNRRAANKIKKRRNIAMLYLFAFLAGASLAVLYVLATKIDKTVASSINFGADRKRILLGRVPGINSGGEVNGTRARGLEIDYYTGEVINNARPPEEHTRAAIRKQR
jgi:hypothetical protein